MLIDTSECYIAEDIMRIKSGCNKLIACIEDVAISENIEENLAVVTVGKRVKIAHHLTNDYESVTDCINKLRVTGGPCLLMEGLFTSLRIIMNQECCFWSVNNYMVPSRIILITDGYDSIADFLDGVGSLHKTEVQEKITKFCEHLTRFKLAKVACVPVRDDYCQPLLKKIAESTHGKIILLADIQRLGRHYKNAKIADNIRNDISEELQTLSIVINRYVEKNDEVADDDIDDIMYTRKHLCITGALKKENQVKEKTIKVGQRVERGPDWIIENEDNGGPGTVVGFTEDGKFLVEWDNRECGIYNLGNGNKQVIPSDKPRFLHDELIAVGCEVKRGKNWRHGNQDGGSGNQGVVFRVEPTGIVHVKWSRGGAYTYKYGFKGYFEVEVCDPSIVNEKALQDKAESSSKEETGGESNSGTEFESEKPASKSIPVYDLPPPTLTNQSDTFIIDDQADSGTNSGETPSEVRDGKLEDSVTSIEPMQDDKLQMVGDNIPMTHGDLPMTHDALPITDGNLQVMHGDLPVTGDDNTSVTRDITHSGDKIPVTSDNISERDNHSKVIDHNLTNERVNANPEKSRNDIKPKSENNNNSDKDGVNVVMDSGLNSGTGELQDLLSSKCETDAKVNVQNVKGNIMFTADRNNTKQENSMENMSAPDGARQKIADINEELDSVTGRRFLSLNDKDLPSASLTKYEMGEPLTDVKKDSLNILPQTQKNLQQGDESLTNLKKDITKFSKPQEKILEGGGESSKDLKKEILKFLPELQENFGLSDESSTNEKKESLKLIPPQHHQNLECQTVGMNFDSSHTGIPVQASSARSNNNQELKFDRPGHIEDSDVFSDTASVVSDISTVIQSCGIWEWKSRRGDWIPYTSAACQKIEKAYRRPKKCTALVEVNGEWYRVVVSKMVQIHTKTRQITSIRRREITDLDD
ncbi:hypothetical protein KUTeg_017717 [Tegillarca granosa]|uniref:RING-type E3 ubiquitin transferase n=1 Tax=Tegillarca granosa TaxID=220873 RepID=A0ABQ9EFR1_TEGGR|nr:hypothetical protein KUTeg_017717 [Tegillarca granosa]